MPPEVVPAELVDVEALTLELLVEAGASRRFLVRRPLHAELDLVTVARFVATFVSYQERIAKVEQDPPEVGAAKLVAGLATIAGDALLELAKAITKALRKVMLHEVRDGVAHGTRGDAIAAAAELLAREDLTGSACVLGAATQLLDALAPSATIPK